MAKTKPKPKYNHFKNRESVFNSLGLINDHRRKLSDMVYHIGEAKSAKAVAQRRTQIQGRISKMMDAIATLRDRFDLYIGDRSKDLIEREAAQEAEKAQRRAAKVQAKGKAEAEKAEISNKKLKSKSKPDKRAKAVWPFPADPTNVQAATSSGKTKEPTRVPETDVSQLKKLQDKSRKLKAAKANKATKHLEKIPMTKRAEATQAIAASQFAGRQVDSSDGAAC